MKSSNSLIIKFNEIGIKDIPLVGGKNASLGEMQQDKAIKLKVPPGFAITAHAYRYFLDKTGLLPALKEALAGLNVTNRRALAKAGLRARTLIMKASLPEEIIEAITRAYKELGERAVAVRSSATAEDLPEASFAGQQESYLNIAGVKELLEATKRCYASLFNNRAIVYRVNNHFGHFDIALSVGVQKMVRSDKASAGVIFTLDTESGFKDVVYITGSYGLGESVVQGTVNPDEFYVFKKTGALIHKKKGEKAGKIIYDSPTKKVKTSLKERARFCLTDDEVLKLAQSAMAIEKHYSKKYGHWTPMDIEWAKDGLTGELFIVQARPETVHSQKKKTVLDEYHLLSKGKVLARGKSIGHKIASGKARVIASAKHINQFKPGEILVTEMTDPDWVPIMKEASAIVTNRGGRTSHAAIVSRELGLPCVVGTNDATSRIKSGKNVTVCCQEEGLVYEGLLKFKVSHIDVSKFLKPKTDVMLNVGNPDQAFELSLLPSSGVGLARQEFIVSEHIRIHPMALAAFDKLKDRKAKALISKLTKDYKDKKQYFIDQLAMGVALIAAAFHPRDVILRFSDFKTNEYRNLIGGKEFEPEENNPMIGWRGASRYYHPDYKEGFALECKAIKKVREEFGLTNLKVMIPVCRTPEEGKKVLKVMKDNGLERGKKGLEVYVMCEVPSNVILGKEFCALFDGISIGSNDLTQMTLAVDRDSSLVAPLFDERDESVKKLIKEIITVARKAGCKIGICGDAPSSYPEFAAFLVKCGIDSISLSPDAFLKTRQVIAQAEKRTCR